MTLSHVGPLSGPHILQTLGLRPKSAEVFAVEIFALSDGSRRKFESYSGYPNAFDSLRPARKPRLTALAN